MHPAPPTWRLTGFVLVSVCLHVGLLVAGVGTTPTIAGHAETVLSVRFAESVVQASWPSAAAVARAAPSPHRKPRPAAAPADGHGATPPAAIDTATPQRNESGTDIDRRAHAARAQIHSRLLADLQRYFEYPLLARRRGWQGTVWLAFIVAPNGALERIHVARGSGYDALDNAAIDALQRVEQMREASAWLDGRALAMELPVIYRLQEP